ncbi:MAG: hypothetical protein H6Q38_169 [Chloroflexi bacterium]|jgi:uncharacterized protein YciI|nr:hypothetical protein [Chloroflexota bacterium]
MEFDRYFVVLLKKGPVWTPESSHELDTLQESHQAHIQKMADTGKMAIAGPLDAHTNPDLRGINIYYYDAFTSLEELKELVEQDPMIRIGRLTADYLTWYVPKGANFAR